MLSINASSFSYRPKLTNLTSINHSQHSILNAMDRFVKCVEKMQSTILVPSRLKDLHIENEQISYLLGESDAYSLYLMLQKNAQELLWGPVSGESTVAMENLTTNFNNLTLSPDLSSTPKESSIISQKINQELIQQKLNQQLNLNKLVKCDSTTSINSVKINTSRDPIRRLKKQDTCLSSDEGFGSMRDGLTNSLNSSLSGDEAIEPNESIDVTSESDCEIGINSKDKLEQIESKDTFHLTAAFRLHLRGFYAILHQLSDTAEFLTEKYQNELN